MADGDPTNIPDLNVLTRIQDVMQNLKNMGKLEVAEQVSNITNKISEMTEELGRLKQGEQVWKDKKAVLDQVTAAFDRLKSKMGETATFFLGAQGDINTLRKNLEGTALGAGDFTKSLSDLTTKMLGAGAAGLLLGTNTGRALLQPFSDSNMVASVFGHTLGTLNEVFRKHAQAQDLVNVGYLALGRSMADIRGRGDLMIDAVQKITAQFFIAGEEQQKFIESTRMVPGGLDAVTTAVKGVGGGVTQMAQIMLVGRGASLTFAETSRIMTEQYQKFGQIMDKDAVESVVKFAEASKATGVPIGIAVSQIQAASQPLAIFGTKITEAQSIWTTFTKSLKGIAPEEVGSLTRQITSNIATMSLGAQGFVAQMSGMVHGVTALGGALRMELAMREPGGMERNLERVMQTISRMGGGRIITLQEASQTPALEMQFQLQRQMVGQMLGVQQGPQQSRVLEVLQNMEKGGASGAEATKNVQELMADGQKAQSASTTAMEKTAMGITRTNSFLHEIVGLEQTAGRELAQIGRALGTAGVGMRPRESDVARATLAGMRAGPAVAAAAPRALERMGGLVRTVSKGAERGSKAFVLERQFRAKMTPTGEPIDPRHPEQAEAERGLATVLPTATGRRPELAPGLPVSTGRRLELAPGPRERRDRLARTVMPFGFDRPEEMAPMGPDETAPGRPGARRGAAAMAAEGERPEALTVTPLEPPTVEIKVICEKCLEKIVDKKLHLGNQGAAGEDYAR